MRMPNFWAQNGPFAQMRIFSEKLLMSLVPFIHAYLHGKQSHVLIISTILTIKEYWILIDQEPYFAVTWKPDFSQECSFCRMLMNHKNFHFTQINKTNGAIFLKTWKTLIFWPFLAIFAWWIFPQKIWLSHTTIYGPLNTVLRFRKNYWANSKKTYRQMAGWTEGHMEGRTGRPYFIGPFQLRPGVQQLSKNSLKTTWKRKFIGQILCKIPGLFPDFS